MSKHPKGVSNEVLLASFPSNTTEQIVKILNKFIAQQKIQLLQKAGKLVYKLKDTSTKNCQGSDIEEKIVFEAVGRAGNNGVAPRDLKFQCNLPQPQITKILKSLESKKLVKAVISSSKKKLFMLFELEPSRTITGGTFYSGQEFESEFVDVLGEQCFKYLLQTKSVAEKLSDPIAQRNASFKASKDICDYISSLNISKVKLTVQDIETILEALVYDGKIEKIVSFSNNSSNRQETQNLYRVLKPLIGNAALMRIPCGVCQVYQDCHAGGSISPATCVYMKEWFEF